MEEIVLSAKKREVVGKQVRAIRRQGLLPAVLYGRNLAPIIVTLNYKETSRILPAITSSQLLIVDIEGEKHMSLVREKQRDPVSGHIIHVDFQMVSMTEKLRTSVVIVLEGEAPAIKNFDGVIVTRQEELEVECLPQDLPGRIVVNVSSLEKIGDSIHVRDIVLPSVVTVLTNPDELVVVVTAQAAEEVEAVAEVVEEPEVIERGKKEEEF